MIARLGPQNYLFCLAIYSIHHQIYPSWFWILHDASSKFGLPTPLHILMNPPPKMKFKSLVRKKILSYWHRNLVESMKTKNSLRFIRPQYIPLGNGPHPVFASCRESNSAVLATTVHARIISGRYRDNRMLSKFSEHGAECTMPGCSFSPGDWVHWLSFQCPALVTPLKSHSKD